ncbi:MAG TPA: zf-HC2 domain-containing protein [Blastocatellia bacterium]|nr:zf-HC2 domain-containing protein [Blastocatellia bacterium]
MKMFNKHVIKKLSAYCNGELPAEEAGRIGEHLLVCERCRREYDDIKLGVQLAERLPLVEAPSELWSEIDGLLEERSRKAAYDVKTGRPWFTVPRLVVATASALTLVLVAGVIWYDNNRPCSSWEVARYDVGSNGPQRTSRVAVGELVETDASSRANISVGLIGDVELDTNSRVRLLETCVTEHRLALDRGRISAKISAPPRLFFVDLPSAQAIDLGCAYTLEVDDSGRGLLHVTTGLVSLVRDGRESWVPIGAMCQTRPILGPGTPYFEDASEALQEALEKFDFENGGDDALKVVLSESRDRDTFTLWQLLSRVDESQRQEILDRIITLVGLPKGVTREAVMRLDSNALDWELWSDAFDTVWF